eukprot:m.106768 g.106768  ORF g.106768 m.106768 type:complete len:311 (-) comp14237_c0_seq2:39-971(-)
MRSAACLAALVDSLQAEARQEAEWPWLCREPLAQPVPPIWSPATRCVPQRPPQSPGRSRTTTDLIGTRSAMASSQHEKRRKHKKKKSRTQSRSLFIVPKGNMKVGVVYLGQLQGKHKFTIVDDDDIEFTTHYVVTLSVEVDRNGNGAQVLALAHRRLEQQLTMYLHDVLWSRRQTVPGIPSGSYVRHKNGITLDNRYTNLELVDPTHPEPLTADELARRDSSQAIFRRAVAQVAHPDPDPALPTLAHPAPIFHECRWRGCHHIEPSMGLYRVCDACGLARYCSDACLEADRPDHARVCRPIAHEYVLSSR